MAVIERWPYYRGGLIIEVYFKCVSITKGLYSVTTTLMFLTCSIASATCTCRLIDIHSDAVSAKWGESGRCK